MFESKDKDNSDLFITLLRLFKTCCGCFLENDTVEIQPTTGAISDTILVLEQNKTADSQVTIADEEFITIDEIEINGANGIDANGIDANGMGANGMGANGIVVEVGANETLNDQPQTSIPQDVVSQREESVTKIDDTIYDTILSAPNDNYFKD